MMNMHDTSEAFAELEPARRQTVQKRTLLVVSADEDCISLNLLRAIEHEFPLVDVIRVNSVEEACAGSGGSATLILIDMSLFEDLRDRAVALLVRHPKALIALLQLGDVSPLNPSEVLSCHFVRSVLPMNLRLDVWLAAVKLLLLGGEYYPFGLLKAVAALRNDAGPIDAPPRVGASLVPDETQPLGSLTARELQILELVARGLQNKLIASALQLSEHTVKIHLHNIINKLGVRNRTEAASLYFDSRALLAQLSQSSARAITGRS